MEQIPSPTPPTPQSDLPMSDSMRRGLEREARLTRLAQLARSGANNFYWIAALSVVNTVMAVSGGGYRFFAGMAATEFVDGLAAGLVQEVSGSDLLIRLLQAGLDVG